MHAALEVQVPARAEQPARTLADTPSSRWPPGQAWLWLAGLLVVVSLSLADGLVSNVVAYERDTVVFYFPLMSWLGQQLQHGDFPLWTPQFFGGYPLFADGEIGLAYPPALLALLTLTPERAFIALRIVHVWLAAAGMFVLARAWRLPYPSAALAGLVFALGNFLQAQIHHENIVRTASWLPLILACVEYALRSVTRGRRLRWTALAALAFGMAGLSLHSQVLAIELMVLAAYAAMRWAVGPLGDMHEASAPWMRRLGLVAQVCVPVVLFGFGLAAVQILPLLELAGFSARGSGIPYDQAAAYSVTPLGLLQLIFPYVFRGPGSQQWGLWTHWESYIFIGLAPLILAVVALVCDRSREVVAWALMGAVALILSLGQYTPINLHYLLWLLPGLSGLRAPGRFTLVVVLVGAMLAGYGLAWLMRADSERVRSARRLAAVLGGVVAGLTVVVVGVHQALVMWPGAGGFVIDRAYLALPRDTYQLTTADVMNGLLWSTDLRNARVLVGLIGLALVVGALWAWTASKWRYWRGWPGVFLAFAAVDLLTFGWAIHPREPLTKIAAEPAAIRTIEQFPSPDAAPNRVLVSPVLNQAAPDRLAAFGTLQEANGYSSLQFIWHRDYLGRVLYADDTLLDLWNVRYIVDPAKFGRLSNFAGVDYLPQQVLLQAPAGSALSEQRFALAGTAPIGELRFVTALMGAIQIPQGAPVADIELRDASDQTVGTVQLQAGRDSMEWAWNLASVQPVVQHQHVTPAGTTNETGGPQPTTRELSFADFAFDSPVKATSMVVRATPQMGEFVLYGGAAVGVDGAVEQLFGKTKAKYQQVYADSDIRVLEDTTAFARAFVVPSARVAPSLGTALSEMIHQPFQPTNEVILADDTTTQSTGLAGYRGGHGTARVVTYSPDAVRVHTSVDGDAWLVLSDTYYPGWTAFVDGQPTTVLRGDVLFRVVPIPAGEHDVDFRFEPTSVRIGLIISVVSLAIVLGTLLLAGRLRRPGRTT